MRLDRPAQACVSPARELNHALRKPAAFMRQIVCQLAACLAVFGYATVYRKFLAIDLAALVVERPHATCLINVARA